MVCFFSIPHCRKDLFDSLLHLALRERLEEIDSPESLIHSSLECGEVCGSRRLGSRGSGTSSLSGSPVLGWLGAGLALSSSLRVL